MIFDKVYKVKSIMDDQLRRGEEFYIRVCAKGNPGNISLMFLTALKMQQALGFGTIANVELPLFDIKIPDYRQGLAGLHDRIHTNSKHFGYLPISGLRDVIPQTNASFLNLEGYCQHMDNFPDLKSLDYDKLFPSLSGNEGGKEDEIVISMRGGDVLEGIHPHYGLIPPEFYQFIINKTKKKPVFYGQLTPSPYMDEIRARFPSATYVSSRGVSQDFDYLRKSKHIILSISTFSWLAAWLSKDSKIYFPVLGMLNPFQHQSMLLPFNDDRYEFYLFPVCFSTHVNRYKEYLDPIRESWEYIDHNALFNGIPKPNYLINDCLRALEPMHYVEMYKNSHKYEELKNLWHTYGRTGLYNHYMEFGFFENTEVFAIDLMYYIQKYPHVAKEIVQSKYTSINDHYLKKGQYLGLSKQKL